MGLEVVEADRGVLHLPTNLLEATQLAVVPGRSFSEFGEGHIRLSFACSMAELEEAADRLEMILSVGIPRG